MSTDDRVVPFPNVPQKAKCPICDKSVVQQFRPFCSRRCADVDLGRWLKGTYRIPTDERPEVYEQPAEDTE